MPAYTEALNPATPADGDLLSAGDDSIRQFKRAIIERLLTLVTDVDTNPLVFKQSAITPKKKRISQTAFAVTDDTSRFLRGTAELLLPVLGSSIFYGSIPMSAGSQIINFKFRGYSNHANGTVSVTLWRVFDGGGPTNLATGAVVTAGGFQTITVPVVQNTLDGDIYVFVVVIDVTTAAANTDAKFLWAELEVA